MPAWTCPKCQSKRVRRSHTRNVIERCLKVFNIRAYRCSQCDWRGLRYSKESSQTTKAKYGPLQIIFFAMAITLTVMAVLYYLRSE